LDPPLITTPAAIPKFKGRSRTCGDLRYVPFDIVLHLQIVAFAESTHAEFEVSVGGRCRDIEKSAKFKSSSRDLGYVPSDLLLFCLFCISHFYSSLVEPH